MSWRIHPTLLAGFYGVCCREMVTKAMKAAMSETMDGSTYPTAKLDTSAALQPQQKCPSVATLQVFIHAGLDHLNMLPHGRCMVSMHGKGMPA